MQLMNIFTVWDSCLLWKIQKPPFRNDCVTLGVGIMDKLHTLCNLNNNIKNVFIKSLSIFRLVHIAEKQLINTSPPSLAFVVSYDSSGRMSAVWQKLRFVTKTVRVCEM